jgi:hypothetical protein
MSIACPKPRAVLTKDQVRDIFRLSLLGERPTATSVARLYRVSEKAVRDIWTARTWRLVTMTLDAHRASQEAEKTGQPHVRKDSRPRTARNPKKALPTWPEQIAKGFISNHSETNLQNAQQVIGFENANDFASGALEPNIQDIDSVKEQKGRYPSIEHNRTASARHSLSKETAMDSDSSNTPPKYSNKLQGTSSHQRIRDECPHNNYAVAPPPALYSLHPSVSRPQPFMPSLMTMSPLLIPAFDATKMHQDPQLLPPPPPSSSTPATAISVTAAVLSLNPSIAFSLLLAAAAAAAAPRSPWEPFGLPAAPSPAALAGPPPSRHPPPPYRIAAISELQRLPPFLCLQ